MLFDPSEEEFHLPAAAINLGDGEGRQCEIVGKEDQALVVFGVAIGNPAEFVGIIFVSVEATEGDDLIAAYSSGLVHFHGTKTFEYDVALGTDDEECGSLMDFVEPLEIQIGTVHDI